MYVLDGVNYTTVLQEKLNMLNTKFALSVENVTLFRYVLKYKKNQGEVE